MDILQDYDMLVAINQATINAQLAKLSASGAIPSRFILFANPDPNGPPYVVTHSATDIPMTDGQPPVPMIDAKVLPQISIDSSGTNVTLLLEFQAGKALLSSGAGPLAKVTQYDMTNWLYGIVVSLDLKGIEANQANIPPEVRAQIDHFDSNMFSVAALFTDLAAVSDEQFQSAVTKCDPAAHDMFVLFMTFYMKWLRDSGSPYILGYSANAHPYASNTGVPDTLLPVGTTFTVVRNDQPDRSCIVYALATKGCHGAVSGSPPNLPDGWGGDITAARLFYAPRALVEPLILHPFYDQLSYGTWKQVSQNINVGQGNGWDQGHSANTGGGWDCTINWEEHDDDRYHNKFSVKVDGSTMLRPGEIPMEGMYRGAPIKVPMPHGPQLEFGGTIWAFKQHTTSMGFLGDAQAWASVNVNWSGTIEMVLDGSGALSLYSNLNSGQPNYDSGHNFGASLLGTLEDIANGIGTALTFGQAGGFLGDLFTGLLGNMSANVGPLGAVLANVSLSGRSTILLPAGDSFAFNRVDMDPLGTVSIDMNPVG